jgi:16S rRNA (guanine527-N7)-methyltransferase
MRFTQENIIAAMGVDTRPSVSRETETRLQVFDDLLMEWSGHTNLIARSTLEDRWQRHYVDSLQLMALLPESPITHLADFGSGAGFPGIILAIMLADEGDGAGQGAPPKISLVESIGKKARFLEAVKERLGLTHVTVYNSRIESLVLKPKPNIITARALSKLDGLLAYAHPHLAPNGRCLFHKGRSFKEELTEAEKRWIMQAIPHQSRTEPQAAIIEIRGLAPNGANAPRK